jgi:hypothetical protein
MGLLSLAVGVLVFHISPVPAANAQSGPGLAIDADATGNEATTLGQRDVCIEVRSGDTFNVDVTGENIVGLAAWEAYFSLDTTVVHVVDRDIQLFLSSIPDANAFDVSESVPEGEGDNGLYRVGGANITDEPIGVDGSGVLARLTLQAAGPGTSTLSVRPVQTDAGAPVGPVLTDADAEQIEDTDGDSFFDGAILDAEVAVDQSCPADADGPIAALAGGDSSGVPSWIFVAAALGVVAAAGFGGLALIRMRRSTRGTP